MIPCELCKIFQSTFFTELLWAMTSAKTPMQLFIGVLWKAALKNYWDFTVKYCKIKWSPFWSIVVLHPDTDSTAAVYLLTYYWIMYQNDQTLFKNLAAFAARVLKCVWPFWGIMHERVKVLAFLEEQFFFRLSVNSSFWNSRSSHQRCTAKKVSQACSFI